MKQKIIKSPIFLIPILGISFLSSCNTTNQEKRSYPLTQTGQANSYDLKGEKLKNLKSGDNFYGQDADYKKGEPMSYTDNGDGTITDNVTGLTWNQNQSEKGMSWEEAKKYCDTLNLGGHNDWRLPSLKELWSIRDFSIGWPYVNTTCFHFAGDGTEGRSQHTWSSNAYLVNTDFAVKNAVFATNDWTGHIKCFEGARYVRAVRGDIYGENDFKENKDNTVSDIATGLMWTKNDSKIALSWQEALKYADTCTFGGYDDWRVPNVKELQSIVDYSGVFPAIDTTYFNITAFNHSDGVLDYPFFWTSTSAFFGKDKPTYTHAWYVAFGYGVGRSGIDLHGAGSVRFIAKDKNAVQEEGGQNDAGQKRHDEGEAHKGHRDNRPPQGPPPENGKLQQGPPPDGKHPQGPPPEENRADRERPEGPPPHKEISAEAKEASFLKDVSKLKETFEMNVVRLVRDIK